MIKAIIFDCFGVIVGKGFEYTYRMSGGDPKKDYLFIEDMLYKANMGQITNKQFSLAMSEKLNISLAEWNNCLVKAEQADKELLSFIKSLRKTYKIAILSNSNKGVLKHKIGTEWLNECFDDIIVSADIGLVKPDHDIYKLTAERLAVWPQECVFIDDKQSFVDSASQLGMKGIKYLDLKTLKVELEKVLT